jgi:pilus assembly protein CpaC
VLREVSAAYGITNPSALVSINPGGPPAFGTANSSTLALTLGTLQSRAITDGFIRALHSRGALRDLAEPNLIAMHGQKASFLAGGEFPIPVIQSVNQGQNAITIIFKEFGVKLGFTPTILDENHIRLDMEPEVSSLDFGAGIRLNDLVIPGLRVRRAKTVLELRDGQSFALAGLLDNSEQVNLSKIPLLGDIPVLGELFKSRRFQRNETELMFLVTVKMVEPLNPDQLPRLPGVGEIRSGTPVAPTTPVEGQSGHSLPRKSSERTAPSEAKPAELSAPVKVDKAASAVAPKNQ